MPAPLPLSDPSAVRLHERPHPDLVSVPNPDLSERAGVAGAAEGCRRAALRAARQLLHLAGTPRAGAATDGPTGPLRLAGAAERHRAPPEPAARDDVCCVSHAVLLVHLPERMGHRHHVA